MSATNTRHTQSDGKLDWTAVMKGGETRIKHVLRHAANDLEDKEVHGVFYGNPIEVINRAWENRANGRISVGKDKEAYVIPYPNSGYESGYGGQGRNLNYVTIVVKRGTNKLVTGYPGNGFGRKRSEYLGESEFKKGTGREKI